MSVSKPQNREEFKKHILTKLGAPVLEINVADEQLDICIDDSFQFFNERNHFNGVERVYLTTEINQEFERQFNSFKSQNVYQHYTGPDADPIKPIRQQNNFIILPCDVVGVTRILRSKSSMGMGGGVIPPGMIYPIMFGSMSGNGCDNTGFGLGMYWVAMSYLALMDFIFYPPKMYNFNQRTHRLHIDGDLRDLGRTLCLECMVKPNPDMFPDLWNDMWLKEMATAMVKAQWGRNLTKYNQVQLPGGIVINGDRILADAQKELETLRTRFAMDFADPPLDEVG